MTISNIGVSLNKKTKTDVRGRCIFKEKFINYSFQYNLNVESLFKMMVMCFKIKIY